MEQSCVDLTIVSPRLEPITQWSVAAAPNDSDHCPITLDFMEDRPDEPVIEKYNIKAAI